MELLEGCLELTREKAGQARQDLEALEWLEGLSREQEDADGRSSGPRDRVRPGPIPFVLNTPAVWQDIRWVHWTVSVRLGGQQHTQHGPVIQYGMHPGSGGVWVQDQEEARSTRLAPVSRDNRSGILQGTLHSAAVWAARSPAGKSSQRPTLKRSGRQNARGAVIRGFWSRGTPATGPDPDQNGLFGRPSRRTTYRVILSVTCYTLSDRP